MGKTVHDMVPNVSTTWYVPCRGVHSTMSWKHRVVESMSWSVVVENSDHVVECKNNRVVEGCRGHHQGGVVEYKKKRVVEVCRGHNQGVSWAPPGGVVEYKNNPVVEVCRGHNLGVSWGTVTMSWNAKTTMSWRVVVDTTRECR